MRKVAITGVGVVSCLGTGTGKVAAALREGRSGVRLVPERLELGFRGALSGVIDDFVPPKLDRKSLRSMTDFTVQACAAALEAVGMAGWGEAELRSPGTGVIVGNDSSGLANIEQVDIVRERKSTFPIGAGLVFKSMTSNVSMNLNVLFGNRGACWTVSGACASGGHAVGQAAGLIATGQQSRVICGAAQEINWQSMASFDATNAFSCRHDAPEQASRPFDANRDGLVPSGGAAMLALEDYELAAARGAQILGVIAGYAFTSDGHSLNVPSGDGLRDCMRLCLEHAQTNPEQVAHICAHATSTPLGDALEAGAIHAVFGERGPWVASTKSMTGHEMWMSGASQLVYAVLMLRGGFIAPNLNFVAQEPGAPKIRVAAETLDLPPGALLVNAAGFGGTNACVLLKAP